jgi:hypothetical protein
MRHQESTNATVRRPLHLLWSYFIPFIAYVSLWAGFAFLRGYADEVPWADSTVSWVSQFEVWLFGQLPSSTLQHHWLTPADRHWYDFLLMVVYYSFFILPLLIAALMIVRNHAAFWFNFWTLAVMEGSALVVHAALPTAPPWIADSSIYKITKIGQAATNVAANAPSSALASVDTNPFAAMPSVHMGVTCALAVTAWRFGRTGYRAASLLYCGAMAICLVYFGEHYVVDEIVGVALTLVAGVVTGRLMTDTVAESLRRRARRVVRRSSHCPPRIARSALSTDAAAAD